MNRFPHNYSAIPYRMRDGLIRYINQGVPSGDFLTAVLSNDLREACGRADDENIRLIPVYIMWLYNRAPVSCFGSEAIVTDWINKGGLSNEGVNEDSFEE